MFSAYVLWLRSLAGINLKASKFQICVKIVANFMIMCKKCGFWPVLWNFLLKAAISAQ